MIVALFDVFLTHLFFYQSDLFDYMFCFVGWCGVFGLFLSWFSNGCLKLCLVCVWCYFLSVCFYFVWPIFDTAFKWLFKALFNMCLVLFLKCLFLVCLIHFWHYFLTGCLMLCLICVWCYFSSVCCVFVWPVFDTVF